MRLTDRVTPNPCERDNGVVMRTPQGLCSGFATGQQVDQKLFELNWLELELRDGQHPH